MEPFFVYREPFEKVCHCYTQPEPPAVIRQLSELDGREGFVIAPFSCSTDCPACLLDGQGGGLRHLPLDNSNGFEAIPDWQPDDLTAEPADCTGRIIMPTSSASTASWKPEHTASSCWRGRP